MNERGYQVVPGYLKETAGLRSVLQARLDEYQPNEAEQSRLDRYLLHDLICRDFIFCLLIDDRRLQGLLSPVLGDNWILYAATSSSLPPSSTNYARRIHRDSAGSHPGRVGAIFALDDFTARTGATEVLPGSHLEHGVDEEAFNRDCEPIECEAGSLILFDARLYHRAGINQTASWRRCSGASDRIADSNCSNFMG